MHSTEMLSPDGVPRSTSCKLSFHSDTAYMDIFEWNSTENMQDWLVVANSLFLLDDFTKENGATRVVPGSHRFNAHPSKILSEIKVFDPAPMIKIFSLLSSNLRNLTKSFKFSAL